MSITCGIDWAERHHDVALVDHEGVVIARQRIDTGVTGFTELVGLIAEYAEDGISTRSRSVGPSKGAEGSSTR